MQRLRTVVMVVVAMAFVAVGCGKKDEGKKADDGKQPAPEAPADKAPPAPADDKPPAPAFDNDAFCAAVFAPADVNGVLGAEGLEPRPPSSKLPTGMGECNVWKRDEHGIPTLQAKVAIDCRGLSNDVEKNRQMAKQIGGDSYKDVDIGKGGGYSELKAAGTAVQQIVYVDDVLPCQVIVNTAGADGKVDALTQHVKAKITDANRPRP